MFGRKRKSLLVEKEKNESVVYGESGDDLYAIFVLTESKEDILHVWLNDVGIYPITVLSNLDDMIDMVENEQSKVLLVVAETGAGLLSSAHKRADMINLLGMANTDGLEITMLYTDITLKKEIRYVLGKNKIEWLPYLGTKSIKEAIVSRGLKYEKGDMCEYKFNIMDVIKHRVTGLPPSVVRDFKDLEREKYNDGESIIHGNEIRQRIIDSERIIEEFAGLNRTKSGGDITGYKVSI